MTDLTTADTTLGTSLTCREWREVIVEEETLLTIVQDVIDELLVALRTEGNGRQGLGLTTGEDGRAVRPWEIVGFDPDRAYLGGLRSIQRIARRIASFSTSW